MIVYGLLLEFSCLTFSNVLGVFSFILSFALLAYLITIGYVVYTKINFVTDMTNSNKHEN